MNDKSFSSVISLVFPLFERVCDLILACLLFMCVSFFFSVHMCVCVCSSELSARCVGGGSVMF